MKPMQWILALVVLVAMVFFITIAMNFLGEGTPGDNNLPPKKDDGGTVVEGPAILTFPATIFYGASGPGSPYEQEKHAGYHDFLFGNFTNEEVTITLKSVGCGKCTSVDVVLAPDELKPQLEPSFFQALLPAMVWALQEKRTQELTAKLQPAIQFENTAERAKQEVKVPPQARGWIRLKWTDEKAQETYTAEVWSKTKTRTALTKVQAFVRQWAEPYKFEETEIALNEMQLEDLQNRAKPKTVVFKLWSPTRTQLHPKMSVVARWKPGDAPIILGEPVPMNATEIAELEEALLKSKTPARVLCAYRLPVTLLDRSPNGKEPFPFGPFRTRFRVSFDDEGVDPAIVMINGKLTGDVRVGGGDDGRFRFGTFDADKGSQQLSVTLYSDVPGLQLEIDQERTPEFLRKNAKIEGPKVEGGESVWVVTTKVPKNTVVGQFPREDSEYFDCAVYVKTKGNNSRSLRIPADGVANTR